MDKQTDFEHVINMCEQSIQGITEAMEQDQEFVHDNEHSDELYKELETSYISRNASIETYLSIIGGITHDYSRLHAFEPLILVNDNMRF